MLEHCTPLRNGKFFVFNFSVYTEAEKLKNFGFSVSQEEGECLKQSKAQHVPDFAEAVVMAGPCACGFLELLQMRQNLRELTLLE